MTSLLWVFVFNLNSGTINSFFTRFQGKNCMIKISTSPSKNTNKRSSINKKNAPQHFEPSNKIILGLINYSKTLFVKKSIHMGIVENLLN
jgi:hypothetical protein